MAALQAHRCQCHGVTRMTALMIIGMWIAISFALALVIGPYMKGN